MVTLLIAAIFLSTPQVPGAKEIRLLSRQDIAEGLQNRNEPMQHIAVISDDGAAVFLHIGKIRRFLLDVPKPAPREDVFYAYVDGTPATYY
ncbi:MAG: hypothetical protein M3R13_09490 [Armatimonadota bacterium]|nr:hypothetical protein [Armatimonadota bacterium]